MNPSRCLSFTSPVFAGFSKVQNQAVDLQRRERLVPGRHQLRLLHRITTFGDRQAKFPVAELAHLLSVGVIPTVSCLEARRRRD